jgi:hypothetical protein
MRRNSALVVLVAALLAIPCLVASAQTDNKTDNKGEMFTAFAASLGTGKTALIEIQVTRWSTDEERQKLIDVLIEKGQDGLLGALQKIRPPCGTIRNVNHVGWDLFYARQTPTPDGGRRVVLATDRRVAFREAVNNTRSMQYQFTLVELHIDKDGKGEGKLVPAAKVSWDKTDKRIEVENYSALPVDLLDVRAKPR